MATIRSKAHVGRALAGLGLALVIAGMLCVMALGSGTVPPFHPTIPLNARSFIAINYGPPPSCLSTPNPPLHDCFQPDQTERELSVSYISPHGARSLLLYRFSAFRLNKLF